MTPNTRSTSLFRRFAHSLWRAGALAGALLLSLASLTGITPVHADTTTWYVDSVNGSNANSGTSPDQPVEGIWAVWYRANAGDTIMLAPGTYSMQYTLPHSFTITGSNPATTVISATDQNGVQDNQPILTISGSATTVSISGVTLSGDWHTSALQVESGTLNLTDDILSQNSPGTSGGAIANYGTTNITQSVVTGNSVSSPGLGGGIINYGTLTVNQSSITNNSARAGGGIASEDGTVTITNSTLSDNTAGGALFAGSSTIGIYNSTVAANRTNGNGGGLALQNSSTQLVNDTISQNTAASGTGGGIHMAGGTSTLTNTILAGNSAQAGPDCDTTLADGGHNLLGSNSSCAGLSDGANGNIVGTAARPVDPQLSVLANNSGYTQTMALATTSPAVSAGSATGCGSGHIGGLDQRGVSRVIPARGVCDIGAYDTASYLPPPPADVTAFATNGQIDVSWSVPPAYQPTITRYVVTCSPSCGVTYVDGSPANTYANIGGLSTGQAYTFTVQAANGYGTSRASASTSPVGFAVAPSPPANVHAVANGNSITLTWTTPNDNGSPIYAYHVYCYDAAVQPGPLQSACNAYNPPGVSGNPPATTITLTSPDIDLTTRYTFAVFATSSVGSGNLSNQSNAVTADEPLPQTPTVQLDPASDTGSSHTDGITNNTTPTFTGTAQNVVTVRVYADNGAGPICTSSVVSNGTWSCTPTTPLAAGPHIITATTVSAGGESSPSAPLSLLIDTTTPVVNIDAATKPANPTSNPGAAFTFTSSAAGAFTCTLDNAAAPCASDTAAPTYSGLIPGQHTFTVSVSDLAGNTGSASYTWTINSTVTAARVTRFTAQRHGAHLVLCWHLASRAGVSGFAIEADHHSLFAHLIPTHAASGYRVIAHRSAPGPYTLVVVLTNGRRLSIRA